ncbi:MAG TPA: AMP-binding protein, partial [Terriglobales bacterium]|nr:AMP-binding protein [Terriglobales bacterium]
MSLQTVNDIFFSIVDRCQQRVMMHREAIQWIPISSQELYRNAAGVAQALSEWGIAKGDRVAILSENRFEWATADFAILLLGAVTVPIYSTLTAEQSAQILCDSGARVIFVSTEKQLQKVQAVQDRIPVEKIVVMDAVQTAHARHMQRLMSAGPPERDPAMDSRARSISSDDLATIIYTSGTTGIPKGVMLTHGNLASNIACSLQGFGVRAGTISISFLPLSHVTARHVDLAMLYNGVTLAYCPLIEHLPRSLL